jgi:hypothetical protein
MKPGDLVRVSKSVWKLSDVGTFEGQVGVIIDVETTPPLLGGDEMFVVLIGGTEQRFYDDELEVISETG